MSIIFELTPQIFNEIIILTGYFCNWLKFPLSQDLHVTLPNPAECSGKQQFNLALCIQIQLPATDFPKLALKGELYRYPQHSNGGPKSTTIDANEVGKIKRRDRPDKIKWPHYI